MHPPSYSVNSSQMITYSDTQTYLGPTERLSAIQTLIWEELFARMFMLFEITEVKNVKSPLIAVI